MSEVKRYACVGLHGHQIIEHVTGTMVLASDYALLEAKTSRLREALTAIAKHDGVSGVPWNHRVMTPEEVASDALAAYQARTGEMDAKRDECPKEKP